MEGTVEHKRQAFDQGLLDALTCPICMNYFYRPIIMCQQGHSLCFECFQKILLNSDLCPTCRSPYYPGSKRNDVAESMLVNLKVPCRYTHLGCDKLLEVATRNEHESDCPFNTEVSCPHMEISSDPFEEVIECSWVGQFNMLIPHICEVHRLQTEVYRGNPRLTFDEVDLSFFHPYLKFKLVYLQDTGLTLLVMLGNVVDAHDIIVTVLEFSNKPRAVTLITENRTSRLCYTRSIYGMQMRHNQGDAGFMLSERDFKLFCTGSTFSFTLTLTDRFPSLSAAE